MKRVTTVTIGIPAYNEAANIRSLLLRVLAQQEDGFTIKEIIILSDGSQDATAEEVALVKDKRIHFIDDHKRLGKSARMEQIFRMNTSDVLILMDADIIFNDHKLFAKFLKKVNFKKSGLATVNVLPLPSETFFERILEAGVKVSKAVAERWENGDNYLTYKGCFLAMDSEFVSRIHMPAKIINNDAYLYFSAKQQGFTPSYVKNYFVYYRSPATLTDHIKQSSRYQHSFEELSSYFGNDISDKYKIPVAIMGRSILESFVRSPFFLAAYIGISFITKVKRQTALTNTWSIAVSTKQKIVPNN